ncbi:MAG TPA: 16S rRNA (cytosine(967)-C(5))-methyltransferase RsmB [Chthoniobacterales bacterium]|jgi:16S rRNA (cytosine967-C5)-methyltransferase
MAHRSARGLVVVALGQWRRGENFADAILAHLLRTGDLSGPDRAFATELFYGILRNITLLDFWIDALRAERLEHDARDLLRLGIYQLFFLGTPEHAAVHETVQLARTKTRPLINAILRSALRRKNELRTTAKKQNLSVRSSNPQFLIDRWTKNFGADKTKSLCEWNNQPATIYARVNRLKISIDDFLAQHPGAEQLANPPEFVRLKGIPSDALARGDCYIQDPSTIMAGSLLDPKPGEKVLDGCAAPGGKTGHLAALMQNRGTIVACDRDAVRILTLQENMKRLGVEIAQFIRHDWTREKLARDFLAVFPFDRILIDAPCSNTGVMRRRVDLRWRLTTKDFLRMQKEQLGILRATIPLLKAGGVLVYSTCSIEPEENFEVVQIILDEFPFLKLEAEQSLLPFRDQFDGAYAAKLIRVV